ncbi:aldehyde oxygenase (deformylating) [Cyanobium sp. CH-040]|uniref:aldehyde oxygenase (deformylating) n=1 Tax=Cyanobium sp. CH-040 TaxID=2823708 RepID=UPI0020CF5E9D|nr:aldehyde oxygenase (deformylating) [Cyanobium sp. CH-040]MCP9929142.1 aldehyde oxygenase (deformylating) [Cyanobium sp. CH-040]
MSAAPAATPAAGPAVQPPRFDAPAYRDAYSRINGLVIVGEGMADRHFRRLAELLPDQRDELLRLGAMEARHARDFVGCGRQLRVRPDSPLARRLLDPLHRQFREADQQGDLVSCLVIQCLIIECFAVAAYRLYLPVADAYARPITEAVIADEAEHLNFGEQWLRPRFQAVAAQVEACAARSLPAALAMLTALDADLRTIGIDPQELVAEFVVEFQASLQAIGYGEPAARQLVTRLTARALSRGATLS